MLTLPRETPGFRPKASAVSEPSPIRLPPQRSLFSRTDLLPRRARRAQSRHRLGSRRTSTERTFSRTDTRRHPSSPSLDLRRRERPPRVTARSSRRPFANTASISSTGPLGSDRDPSQGWRCPLLASPCQRRRTDETDRSSYTRTRVDGIARSVIRDQTPRYPFLQSSAPIYPLPNLLDSSLTPSLFTHRSRHHVPRISLAHSIPSQQRILVLVSFSFFLSLVFVPIHSKPLFSLSHLLLVTLLPPRSIRSRLLSCPTTSLTC